MAKNKKKKSGEMSMIIRGYARDSHENFPITFKFTEGKNPVACFYGCTVEAPVETNDGEKVINKKMAIAAFGEIAEELAEVEDGDWIEIIGDYQLRKNEKNGVWYPQVVISEVLEIS